MSKKLNRRARLAKRRWIAEGDLAAIKAALPSGAAEVSGVLKALHRFGSVRVGWLRTLELRPRLKAALVTLLSDPTMQLSPRDFGARDMTHLVEMFLVSLDRMNYSAYSRNELRLKKRGLKAHFVGELLEQLVLNHQGLQAMFQQRAGMQLSHLAELVASGSESVVDGLGKPLKLEGKFDPTISRATDITVYADGVKKYTDFALVTAFTPAGSAAAARRPLLALLVEVEVKMPRAAKRFAKQIDAARGRLKGADYIEMTIDGQRVRFKPEQVMLDAVGVTQNAVRPTPHDELLFSWKATRNRSYFDVGLNVKTAQLMRLVEAAFRSSPAR